MAYCVNCGRELDDRAVICPTCGVPQQSLTPVPTRDPSDSGSAGWGVLGFFIPLVGLILYLVWSDTRPLDAKVAGKGALIGVIVSVALSILFVIIYVVFIAILVSRY